MSTIITYSRKLAVLFATFALAILGVVGFFSLVKTGQARAAFEAPDPSRKLPQFVLTVNTTGTLYVIDSRTDIVYGPFLTHTLGSEGGGLFDIAVTPDGKTALISNFGDSIVSFVDIANPLNPTFIVSVTMPMFAEDIDITPDGRFALVTDGGFSPYVATIDVVQRTLAYSNIMTSSVSAQAVAIGAYNTVVTANYFGGGVDAYVLYETGQVTHTNSYTYRQNLDGSILSQSAFNSKQAPANDLSRPAGGAYPDTAGFMRPGNSPKAEILMHTPRPVNVAIAPDRQTVLVCDVVYYNYADSYSDVVTQTFYSLAVYQITGPGELELTGVITGLSRATQSIAFDLSGFRAYLSGNAGTTYYSMTPPAQLSVVDILRPGQARLEADGIADYPRYQGSQLFGVDTIAIANGKVYLGHPTISGITPYLRIVDLADFSVKRLAIPMSVGVAVTPIYRQIYLPLVIQGPFEFSTDAPEN